MWGDLTTSLIDLLLNTRSSRPCDDRHDVCSNYKSILKMQPVQLERDLSSICRFDCPVNTDTQVVPFRSIQNSVWLEQAQQIVFELLPSGVYELEIRNCT